MKLKRMLSVMAGVLTLVLCMYGGTASAAGKVMRVKLTVESTDTFTDPQLENVSGEPRGYTIGVMNGTEFNGGTQISESQITIKLVDNVFQVCNTNNGAVLYSTEPGADHLAIKPNSLTTWFKKIQWNGIFVYRRASSGSVNVINYVELEDYVKGVLPYEMYANWGSQGGLEALKAQAVCARSFALCTTKHAKQGYDLCNTTDCQVYRGVYDSNDPNAYTKYTDAAVDLTTGQTITYNGKTVEGLFFDHDGGATEDAANVWGYDYPYLKGKVDPYEQSVKNEPWSVTLTADQLRQKLSANNKTIGQIMNVEVTKRTPLDNVNEVTITDVNNNKLVLQRSEVRNALGLKSIRYTITPNTKAVGSLNTVSVDADDDELSGAPEAGFTEAEPVYFTALQIVPSTHNVQVDGNPVNPRGYNINGNNYFKLRDIAYVLNGTAKQFNVTWDKEAECIGLFPNTAYQPDGSELTAAGTVKNSVASNSNIQLDGKPVSLSGYNINGNNYYKIRDIGSLIGFNVDFEDPTVIIRTGGTVSDNPNAAANAPVSYTFNGKGNGHSVGMSQWGAYAMSKQGFKYDQILKFYYTGIEVK